VSNRKDLAEIQAENQRVENSSGNLKAENEGGRGKKGWKSVPSRYFRPHLFPLEKTNTAK